jgi:dual specificity tyrosine-phosphorylation-regulated kinase 2/3/4
LFPGEDESDQLACIIELLGAPPQKLLDASKRARNFISSKGYPRYCTVVSMPDGSTVLQGGRSKRGKPRGLPGSKDWTTALKGCDDPFFIDFLKRCLDWDPTTRMTASQALRHSWIRRRLPKPPNENPPSRRSSASFRHNTVNNKVTSFNTNGHNNPSDINKHMRLPKIGSYSNLPSNS